MTVELTTQLKLALQTLAADVAREAGTAILKRREAGVTIADTKSSITDVVTEADQLAEQMIVEAISKVRPTDGLYAEEGHTRESTTGIEWVIDPIDGTVNYLYNLPAYCVSVAATVADSEGGYSDGRRPIAAAVYSPRTEELFTAAEGLGAHRNGEAISASKVVDPLQALLATGFGYTPERRTMQGEVLGRIIPHVRDIRRLGSAAYDLCMVASGRIDAYYEIGIQPWDWAGGALIATEAGAITLGKNADSRPGSELFIAGPTQLAKTIQTLIATS